ncbi:MAG: hypothetical protein WAN29_15355, partial [Candidatus Sulfotelmatobacter sp.]
DNDGLRTLLGEEWDGERKQRDEKHTRSLKFLHRVSPVFKRLNCTEILRTANENRGEGEG